jgi:type IV pilus assembly protein PilV
MTTTKQNTHKTLGKTAFCKAALEKEATRNNCLGGMGLGNRALGQKALNKKALSKKTLNKKQSGMMLVEVLVAILLFSVGLLGLVALQTVFTQNSVNSGERTIAASLANDIVSQMLLRNSIATTAAPLEADITSWQTRVTQILPNATGTVVSNNGVATVTITWKSPSKRATDNQNRLVTSIAI